MTWLSPLLLWGLAALSVPLLLHVLRQAPRRRYEFPSLFLLKKVTQKYRRRMVLMELLLLLLRLAVVAAVVLAFAGPKLKEKVGQAGLGNNLVLLYDDTASMARLRGGTSLFQAARTKMKALLSEAPPTARVTLVSATGHHLTVDSPKAALSALPALAVSHAPADLPQALRLARRAFDQQGGRLFLLGDFQATTWDKLSWRAKEGVAVNAVPLSPDEGGSLVVENVAARGQVSAGSPFTLEAVVAAPGVAEGQQVRLLAQVEDGGRAETTVPASAAPQAARFRLTGTQTGSAGVRVRAAAQKVLGEGYGLVGIGGLGRTLVVAGEGDAHMDVLTALLEASDGPAPRLVPPKGLAGVTLEDFDAIVVAGAAPAVASRRDTLVALAKRGKAVVTFPAPVGEGGKLAVLTPTGVQDAHRDAGQSSFWMLTSKPSLFTYTGPMAGNWPGVKVRAAVALSGGGDVEELASLSNGLPAVVRTPLDDGAWVTFAVSLDPGSSDVAYMPAFAPLMLRLLQPNLATRPWQLAVTGDVLTLPWEGKPPGSVRVRGVFSDREETWQVSAGGRLSTFPGPGVWAVGDEGLRVVVNLAQEEQVPATLTVAALKSRVEGVRVAQSPTLGGRVLTTAGDPLWLARVLVVLALALMLLEAVVANSRRMTAAPGV